MIRFGLPQAVLFAELSYTAVISLWHYLFQFAHNYFIIMSRCLGGILIPTSLALLLAKKPSKQQGAQVT